MSKNIGIKLADGTFYPIMEDGIPKKKLLELTTVKNNQTTVMVDLYRSETNSMDDAEYVDTLQISGLVPHGEGEPNICLSVQLDENNVLSAEVSDPESGTSSNTTVNLVTRAEDDRSSVPDFTLSDVSDQAQENDITIDDEAAFADDAFPAEFPDTIPAEDVEFQQEIQEVPESNPEAELGFDLPPQDEQSNFDEEAANLPEFDIPRDFENDDYGNTGSDNFDLPDFDENPLDPDYSSEDYTISDSFFSNDEAYNDYDDYDSSTKQDSNILESSLPDFSKFELPDFDDPGQNAGFATSSGLFNDTDFDDPAFQEQPLSANSPGFDFSDLYDDPVEISESEGKKQKNTLSVVVCVVCAIICLAALLLILFLLPSKISIDISRKTNESNSEVLQTEPEVITASDITALPIQPEPKEDVIVVAETPAVVPLPPSEPEIEPETVRYKIKWGDTLWDLADSYYNNPWLYKKIATANGIKNPDYIVSGTYISIPPK